MANKSYTLHVHDCRTVESDLPGDVHTGNTMLKAMRHAKADSESQVHVRLYDRTKAGWLEHSITVVTSRGSQLYMAAIQRTPESDTEFCS